MKPSLQNILQRRTVITFFLLTLFINIEAQNDSTEIDFRKQFEDFKTSIQTEFNNFKSTNDSIFYNFLLTSWKSFKLLKDEPKGEPKPEIQPIINIENNKSIIISPIKKRNIDLKNNTSKTLINLKPVEFEKKANIDETTDLNFASFDFYGLNIKIPKENLPKHVNEGNLNRQIASFYRKSCNDEKLLRTINFLQVEAIEKNLNGWGYLNLIKKASFVLFNKTNNRVLFTWFSLLKSGYDVKAGYTGNNIYLLVNFDIPVYFKSYLEQKGKKYYIILFYNQKEPEKNLRSYDADYPERLNHIQLYMSELPNLKKMEGYKNINYLGHKIKIAYNKNLIDFYKSYPECDLSVYFPPPLSKQALKSLDNFILPELKQKSIRQQVDFLLDFVQHAIAYKTDYEQFGRENYLFAEETLFYPYADCEDRVVLLYHLIKHYTDLKSIALLYDGHVSFAVNIPENIEGTYVYYNNKKFYVADPTYIGASVGMIMPDYENRKPEILTFK
jgi:hypothetical protein